MLFIPLKDKSGMGNTIKMPTIIVIVKTPNALPYTPFKISITLEFVKRADHDLIDELKYVLAINN